MRQIHAARRAPGVERIYAPGEPEFLTKQRYKRDGIPLTAQTLADLRQAANVLNVATDGYSWL